MDQPRRVGVYGGSFDPIHIGHLAVAEDARAALDLAAVLVIPAAQQPLKRGPQGASPEHRLAMTRLACADNPALIVDEREVRRPPPSYSVDTLLALREELGAAELWLILGVDAAHDLPRWHQIERVLALARLAIVERPGVTFDSATLEQQLPWLRGRYRTIEGPRLEISSTELRRRLAAGRPVRYQIPEPVRSYIAAEGLYEQLAASR